MNKIELLNILNEKVCQCTKCPELVENRTQTVLHSGNPNAKILFLAEAPGRDEDEQGEVLVGRAGKLFTNIIKACGWTREDVYCCNILKCRPPHNRTPTSQEAQNCEPFLKLQIRIVNPKYIVCLGSVAAQNLLKTEERITHLRGRWFQYVDRSVNAKVLCSYHPSYLLRNQSAKEDVWEDLQLLIKEINNNE